MNASVPEVPGEVTSEAQLFQRLARVPNIGKATCHAIGSSSLLVQVTLSQRDVANNKKRSCNKQVLVPDVSKPEPTVLPLTLPDYKDATFVSSSPSGARTLVARAAAEGKSMVLAIWGSSGVLQELIVPAAQHGALYNDGWFSRGAAWSPDESRVVYVAEAPVAEKTPEWGNEGASKDVAAPKGWRGQAAFVDDWGELNTGKKPPSLFLLDLEKACVTQVEGLPQDCSLGQPLWAPDGSGLLFVGWAHDPANFKGAGKKLGVVYCFNRPCAIYYSPLSPEGSASTAVALTDPTGSAFMPLFSPDGSWLLFLSQQAAVESGVHNATSSLHSLPWPQGSSGGVEASTVVPVVQAPATPTSFPGLYTTSFVDSPFLSSDQLLVTSQWRCGAAILAVHLPSGGVTPITPITPLESPATWTLLATLQGLVVASCSTPASPPTLMLGTAPPSGGGEWRWQEVGAVTQGDQCWGAVAEVVQAVQHEVLQVTPTCGEHKAAFEAIVIRPKRATGPLPTILTPHGGPHTAYTAAYYMPYVPLLAAGYCILAVNYRGSTGFGEAALQSLPGSIGSNDVADCMAALDACIAAGITDSRRVSVIGGSHGGFLTGHLLGQHPERFCCGVLRNPVCNLSFMAGSTDIPDWTFVEAFGTQEGRERYTALPGPEVLARLFEVSPAAHVARVTAPMAFMLGAKDRRVPMQDALQYISALRARGVETRVIVFPEDTHALDKPQTEFEQWLNALWWLKKHVPQV